MAPCMWLVSRPKPYLMAFIYALVVSGIFAVEGSVFHVFLVLAFGLVGYLLRAAGVPVLPMVLGGSARVHGRIQLPPQPGVVGRRLT